MFNIGITEIMLILGVALLILGPQKLPEVARMVGRGLREFRRTTRELEEELDPIRETLRTDDLYDDDYHSQHRDQDGEIDDDPPEVRPPDAETAAFERNSEQEYVDEEFDGVDDAPEDKDDSDAGALDKKTEVPADSKQEESVGPETTANPLTADNNTPETAPDSDDTKRESKPKTTSAA